MSRNSTGGTGTIIRRTQYGQPIYTIMAVTRFPAPDFLSTPQKHIWNAALGDIPLEFFRARHIPMMIQYCRAMEALIGFSDEYQADPDDPVNFHKWNQMFNFVARMEKHLGLTVGTEQARLFQSRADMRIAAQERAAREAGSERADGRKGLVYNGNN